MGSGSRQSNAMTISPKTKNGKSMALVIDTSVGDGRRGEERRERRAEEIVGGLNAMDPTSMTARSFLSWWTGGWQLAVEGQEGDGQEAREECPDGTMQNQSGNKPLVVTEVGKNVGSVDGGRDGIWQETELQSIPRGKSHQNPPQESWETSVTAMYLGTKQLTRQTIRDSTQTHKSL